VFAVDPVPEPAQAVFNTAPPAARDWALLARLGVLPLLADDVDRCPKAARRLPDTPVSTSTKETDTARPCCRRQASSTPTPDVGLFGGLVVVGGVARGLKDPVQPPDAVVA